MDGHEAVPEVAIAFTLRALFLGLLGVWCTVLGLQVYQVAMQHHRWSSRWLRRLPGLRGTLVGAAPGEQVCLEGRCAGAADQALICPVFRASCVAFWLRVRFGLVGRVKYRQSHAVRFWLERGAERGGRVLVDPTAVGLVELERGLDTRRDTNSRQDPELERHLEDTAVHSGTAASLGIVHSRLEPGQVCTVVGHVTSAEALGSPYREPQAATIGGVGHLYITRGTKRGLLRRLRLQRGLAVGAVVVAYALLGAAALLVGSALVQQPLLYFVAVPSLMVRHRVARGC